MVRKHKNLFCRGTHLPAQNIVQQDLINGARNYRIWLRLAQNDIFDRYQRSRLGAIWISLSMLIMVITFGVLYGKLFNRELSSHVPYVAAGLAIWLFYSEMIVKGCQAFNHNRSIIQQLPLPLSTFIYQVATRELIILAHHLVVVAGVFVFYNVPVSFSILTAIPALLILVVNAFAITLALASLSTRYHDLVEIVTAVIRPMMFITPIIWSIDLVPDRAFYVVYNPIYHLIEIIRAPLIGEPIPIDSWWFSIGFTLLVISVSLIVYGKCKQKIVYWL